MKKIFFLFAWVLITCFTAHAETAPDEEPSYAEQVMQSLHWYEGPTTVTVGSNATFNVPEGYMFLNPADTDKLLELMQNPPTGNDYYFGPSDFRWFGFFSYDDTGHVKDDETIDADAVLGSIREGTEESNKMRIQNGWDPMEILGWKFKPFYDTDTKRLSWAINGKSGEDYVINYNTRILGRTGVTSAVLVVDPEELTSAVAEFKTAVENYAFNPEQKYSAFQEGDKLAEYGLAALIAGGAAAVATKKGLWATIVAALAAFWKFIAAGVVGLFAMLFGKKRNRDE